MVLEIKKLIDEGYIRHIGLSEVDSETFRRRIKSIRFIVLKLNTHC
ncbi:MAG: hypothetical protein E7192_03150 [Erysipelotrichaceae bacterium]|nr:hypothetical protein [Erysipelotrichaceae bacterium]